VAKRENTRKADRPIQSQRSRRLTQFRMESQAVKSQIVLLASLKPNDKLRDDFLAGVRDSFDKYADAMAMRDLDHN